MKKQTQIRFALTGATGFLGRNLLLEIVKQNYKNLSDIEILILGRSEKENSLRNRIADILREEVLDYVNDSSLDTQNFLKMIMERIKCVNISLGEPELGLNHDDYQVLSSRTIDFFYHIAALTDFRDGKAVMENLEKINVFGTKELLNLVSNLKVSEFIYVGSAYSCGLTAGIIMPDYVNLNQKFRNHYEKTKLKAEILVREFKKKVLLNVEYSVLQQYVAD
jgi:thioester reductase-like protein